MSESFAAEVGRASARDAEPCHPAMSIRVTGPDYEGHLVIDTLVENRSAGGVRIADDLPLDEVRELAREMSLKYSLFHLPRGGAKAGIRMASGMEPARRIAALEDFGRKLAPIFQNGIYSPGMDMNCGPEELRAIYRGANIGLGVVTDTSWFTALGVFHSIQAAADRLQVRDRPVTLAIEGFGSVARHLVARLDPGRFRITSMATIRGAVRGAEPFEPGILGEARDRHGDDLVLHVEGERATREDVLTDSADIILPASRTRSITPAIAERWQGKAVVPIANAPYVEGAVETLSSRGVLCLPGYVSNCGGVLASSLKDQGLAIDEVEALFASRYRAIVDGILRVAAATGRPGTSVAEELACAHMPARAVSRPRSFARRIYDRFLAHRRPAVLKASTARRDFTERSGRLLAEINQMESRG
jgi:glutamate dehydrogenase (NAD(P)+)